MNDIAAVQQSKLVLKAKDARTTGAIRYDRTQNALVGWKNAGNAAFWDLQSIDPGRYDVLALYSVSTGRENPGDGRQLSAGGTFIVRQETGLVGDVTESVSHRVASTGDWDKFTSVKCGQMTFSRTSATFVVECGNAEELGVMYLREMELRKVGDGAGGRERNVADQFSSLAAAHLQEVETLLSPIEKVYLAALRKYKDSPEAKEEIERKELEIAERRKQMAQSAPPERATPVGGVHVLSAIDREATYLSGKAVVHSSGEFVTALRPPDSYVQWDLDRLKVAPGDYDLIVEYRTMDNMGGEFRVQCGSESVDGRVRLSPFGELNQDFCSQRAGKLRVTSGARTIRFEPLDLDSRDGSLCDLRKLTLEPSTGRAVEHVHVDGYTEWNGATFVDGGDSAGDRFTIRYGGKNYSIRLYAVTCPPGSTSETKSDDFKSVRDHFGVNPNDLARGGRLAAQATADVLGRGPFSVFTKGKKAKDGARFAWVVVENDTLLSGILVGRGLASIDGEESAIPEAIGRGIDGAKYKAWLQSQETEAKAGKEGIWRYHRD
ncbi:MAG: hypothetical protein R3F19_09570 [Verrucomicrobiales bacterium]